MGDKVLNHKFKNRYVTKGVQLELPPEMQIILWSMVDENIKKGLPMDYLQIFELKPVYLDDIKMQEISHKQEQPRRTNTFAFETDNPISAKIFIIDSIEYSTMMFNYEY